MTTGTRVGAHEVFTPMRFQRSGSRTRVHADTLRTLFLASVSTAQLGTAPYDVTADGQRFLLGEAVAGEGRVQLHFVVVNWERGLKK